LEILDLDWDEISDEMKHEHIKMLFVSSEKNYHLLEDMLNWGKAQQGLIKCKPESFLLLPTINEVAELFNAQIKNKKLELKIEIPPEAKLNTDQRLFAQIIQNLVDNAIKYTPHGGHVLINFKVVDGAKMLCLEDTGIGIPENKIASIFDLDSDFNRPGTDNEKSTGMGLILSKEYAHLLGATLTVQSKEGAGSTFCLLLP
jgi:signal transduction histidine kinase